MSSEMALRLSKALGRTPENWLQMQHNDNLWMTRRTADLSKVHKMDFVAA